MEVVQVLEEYGALWKRANGPELAELIDPTEGTIDRAIGAAGRLQTLIRGMSTHLTRDKFQEED
eukprot:3130601-Karenia_brevis.AAC.1